MALSAPQLDTMIYHAQKLYEITDERTKNLTFELFQKLQLIAICGNDERRDLWVVAPRGSIDEFGSYEEYLEAGEVESRIEFEDIWLSEYPEPQKWYLLSAMIYKDIYSVFIDGKLVLQFKSDPPEQYPYDKYELVDWLLTAVENAITLLKAGEYNKYVNENLPYRKRIGKILREDYWRIFREEKEEYLKDIEPDEIARFTERIKEQKTDKPVFYLKEMTAGLFFDCCRLGYEANQYEGIEKYTPKELYKTYADGRDEGLLNLDERSAKAFDTWFHDRMHIGGHPWEVCSGGNSTHISLYVKYVENGWWFALAGSSLSRSVETVKFYLSLVDNGLPVSLIDGGEIAAMLTGKDYIGIVPEGVHPRYCDSLFPGEKMLMFMNLPLEETEKVENHTSWYPIKEIWLS